MIIDTYWSTSEIVDLLKLYLWKNEIKVETNGNVGQLFVDIKHHGIVNQWCKFTRERYGDLGISIETSLNSSSF
jgi:hypothetical protein